MWSLTGLWEKRRRAMGCREPTERNNLPLAATYNLRSILNSPEFAAVWIFKKEVYYSIFIVLEPDLGCVCGGCVGDTLGVTLSNRYL